MQISPTFKLKKIKIINSKKNKVFANVYVYFELSSLLQITCVSFMSFFLQFVQSWKKYNER